jgi:hypothetical protein
MALGLLGRPGWQHMKLPDHLSPWMVDGYGFAGGFFRWRRYVQRQAPPDRVSGYSRRVFDQGLGRSIWFVDGADVARIPATIAHFPIARQADLWHGVSFACAYAGGVDRSAVQSLREVAGVYGPYLAQGAAFAAHVRQSCGNLAPQTELACEVLGGLSGTRAAELVEAALDRLPLNGPEPALELWQRRVRAQLPGEPALA